MENPADHFEAVYARANGEADFVPWADLAPNPHLLDWLASADKIINTTPRTLVIGSGLGDDAEELARRGCLVTAFDIAPTAIEWTRRRFASSPVAYLVADLLDPPAHWVAGFDLVVESYTIQALPPRLRRAAIGQVARLIAPGGHALVIARRLLDHMNADSGPPWPLSEGDLGHFAAAGLRELTREQVRDADGGTERWRAVFANPPRA